MMKFKDFSDRELLIVIANATHRTAINTFWIGVLLWLVFILALVALLRLVLIWRGLLG
jgi:hypothetical protein